MRCNGCGGSFTKTAGRYLFGEGHQIKFCPGCHRVLKSVVLNSDLSEQWENEDLPEGFPEDYQGRTTHPKVVEDP